MPIRYLLPKINVLFWKFENMKKIYEANEQHEGE